MGSATAWNSRPRPAWPGRSGPTSIASSPSTFACSADRRSPTRAIAVPTSPSTGIPITYVPARNTIFLSLALAYAEVTGSDAIFTGANAVDYSGYPDCRPEYLEAFESHGEPRDEARRRGRADPRSWRPIVKMTKADIVRHGHELGVDFSLTVSCYNADADGRACGQCDSCRLRREGFATAGLADPTRYRR